MSLTASTIFANALSAFIGDHNHRYSPEVALPLPPSSRTANIARSCLTRRASLLILLPIFIPYRAAASTLVREDLFERYTDEAEGFTLLIPPSWKKVEKAGATALFEEGKNNIGVVVDPIRLSSLREFGPPDFVAEKILRAEKKKESTKSAELVATRERLGHNDVPIYEIEYKLDSTRGGMKTIFSSAFVFSKKLYLLNIACSDNQDNPLKGDTRLVLEQVLHSFDAV